MREKGLGPCILSLTSLENNHLWNTQGTTCLLLGEKKACTRLMLEPLSPCASGGPLDAFCTHTSAYQMQGSKGEENRGTL